MMERRDQEELLSFMFLGNGRVEDKKERYERRWRKSL
jgi:hypothetical protein